MGWPRSCGFALNLPTSWRLTYRLPTLSRPGSSSATTRMLEAIDRVRSVDRRVWVAAAATLVLYGLSCVPLQFWKDLLWCIWALLVGTVCFGTPYLIKYMPFWPSWSSITKVQYCCVSFLASFWLFLAQPVGYDLVELILRAILPEYGPLFRTVNGIIKAANLAFKTVASLLLSGFFGLNFWDTRRLLPTVTFCVSLFFFCGTLVGTAFGLWRLEHFKNEAREARIAARKAEAALAEKESEMAQMMASLSSVSDFQRIADEDEEQAIKSRASAKEAAKAPSSAGSSAAQSLMSGAGSLFNKAKANVAASGFTAAAGSGMDSLFKKLVGPEGADAYAQAEAIEGAKSNASAEAAASARIDKLEAEARRPLDSVAVRANVPLTQYLTAAISILDDGREAFSRGNYPAAFVLLTRYMAFATQLLPKHPGYASPSEAVARAVIECEEECALVCDDELPAVRHELLQRILEEERGSAPSWW